MAEPPKKYITHESHITIIHKTRKALRDALIQEFLKEDGGYIKDGIKFVQAYRYYVESLKNGKRVYLQRPAHLNKGMDFQVCVEGLLKYKNGKDKPPSHSDVIEDLKLKKSQNLKEFKQLKEFIDKVWNCEEPNDILKTNNLSFTNGFSVEEILKILKWLFIEQDMTYWSFDGRDMLKRGIDEI
jgi:hypothetical protein